MSIIIPVFNAEDFILRCIQSISKQNYKNYEVLIIDDCGTDDSVRKVQEYLEENTSFPCVIIRNILNEGPSRSRNRGVQQASGEYILFCDADDELSSEDTVRLLLNKLLENSVDFVVGTTKFIKNEIEVDNPYHVLNNKKDVYLNSNEILEGFFSGEWAVTPWNKLYDKNFLKNNNLSFLPDVLHEDEFWGFETAVAANKIAFINETTYTYYSLSNPTSITGNIKLQNYIDLKRMLFKMMKIAYEQNLINESEKTLTYLQNFAINSILGKLVQNYKTWKKVYKEISAEFSQYNFLNQKYFKKPPFIAYQAYRAKFDHRFLLYKKIPKVVAKFL